MSTKFYRMFAGELDGELVLSHIALTARDVRESVCRLFLDGATPGHWRPEVWKAACRAGWRVVPLSITKYTGGRRRPVDTYVGIDIANRGTE